MRLGACDQKVNGMTEPKPTYIVDASPRDELIAMDYADLVQCMLYQIRDDDFARDVFRLVFAMLNFGGMGEDGDWLYWVTAFEFEEYVDQVERLTRAVKE